MKPILPTERRSLKQQTIEAIKQYIIEEGLRANDKLPTERKLVTMFGVSRSVVREALSYLENTGVIRVRQGQGAFLNASNIDKVLENFFFLWNINDGNIKEMLGLRLIFESSAIEEIVMTGDDKAIASIKDQVEKSLQVDSLDALRVADMAFHTALLKATNNQLFIQLTDVITNYFFKVQHVTLSVDEYRTLTHEHMEIVEALEARDAKKAKDVLANHMKQAKI